MVSASFVILIGRLLPDSLGGLTNKRYHGLLSLDSLFIMENFMKTEILAEVVNLKSKRTHTVSNEDSGISYSVPGMKAV